MSEDLKQSQLFESVSALVDNQATPLELQRILAHTEKNTGVRSRWHRYQLASAVLRGEAAVAGADLSDKVKAAIADIEMDAAGDENVSSKHSDTKPAKADAQTKRPWYASYGRVAIAASVTLAAVLGSQQLQFSSNSLDGNAIVQPGLAVDNAANQNPNLSDGGYQRADLGANPNLSRLNVQNVSSASFSAPSQSSRMQALNEFQAQRQQQLEEEQVRLAIQRLMLEHAQQTTRNQGSGLLPFIRVSDSAISAEASQ